MTKEQIIDNLKYQNEKFFGGQSETLTEAVKVLEQQSYGCITREQAIQKAKEQYSEIWDCDINHPKYEDTVEEIVTGVIQLIMQPTSDGRVSLEVYKQVAWERDIAIEQLKELGYEFGEKIRTCDDCVSRQAVTDAVENTIAEYIPTFIGRYEKIPLELALAIKDVPPVTPTHGTCKDCKNFCCPNGIMPTCKKCFRSVTEDFYCAEFEKRGEENGSN